jgi:pyruvate dehydrogenase E2 component (dihydrolipoamide acetyltransferase)
MTDSFQAPHFYLTIEVDTWDLGKARNHLIPIVEKKVGTRLTYTDLLIKIVAQALVDHPELNCAYWLDGMRKFQRIDIGLVTFVEGGLVVPVIRKANQKSLADISQARVEIVQKAREKKLSLDEMSGSTFTISNLGMYGIDQFSAVLNPPEAAILAIGRIGEKPVVHKGQILIRPMMTLTLSIDHRVLDGVLGSQFLQAVKGYVENPVHMLL